MPQDNPIVRAKRITDLSDELKQKDVRRELLRTVRESIQMFESAYQGRREELLEINALYRNKSWFDKNKAEWQTKAFIPLTFDAVERKTSMVHEALWGNRFASPFTAIGKTPEDHAYAFSAETVLNNTMDSIGFYEISEEGIRSCVKYGLGMLRHGWEYKKDKYLWRETVKNDKGEVRRNDDGSAVVRYIQKEVTQSRPFVKSLDVVNNCGWDPTAKRITKDGCAYVYELGEASLEAIYEKEQRGEYDAGSYDKVHELDPHGLDSFSTDNKEVTLRETDGLQNNAPEKKTRFSVVYWEGWFDIDGDGRREFICCEVLENRLILNAKTLLTNEYSFVDLQYSRSLHTLTPWGVIDPVINLQYIINDVVNQRGDANKHMLSPQFMINIDNILEEHSYISIPGEMHPFHAGEGDVSRQMRPLQFQTTQHLGVQEEQRLLGHFEKTVGVADFNSVLTSSNKDTPASTLFGILNEQQSTNSMIVNGILNRFGVLGSRVLRNIQLFGDDRFIIRSAGKRGLEFREESLENILGDFDIKVSTSTFFGNRQIELQHMIQLKPMWQNAPHIDQVELDRAILENIMPKRVDRVLKVPEEPLSPVQEQLLFLAGQGEAVVLSEQEQFADLQNKLKLHNSFKGSEAYDTLDDLTKEEFDRHLDRIADRIEQLQLERQLQAQQASRGTPQQAPNGNLQNTGLPEVREQGNQLRPRTNNFEQ